MVDAPITGVASPQQGWGVEPFGSGPWGGQITPNTVGTLVASGAANILLTGIDGAGAVGDPTAIAANATVVLTGIVGPTVLNSVGANGSSATLLSSIVAAGQVGDLATDIQNTVFLVGLEAVGALGTFFLWGEIAPPADANWTDINTNGTDIWTDIDPGTPPTWAPIDTDA